MPIRARRGGRGGAKGSGGCTCANQPAIVLYYIILYNIILYYTILYICSILLDIQIASSMQCVAKLSVFRLKASFHTSISHAP